MDRYYDTVVQTGVPRSVGTPGLQQVQDWLFDALTAAGLQTERDDYGTGVNVVATHPGTDLADEWIVVSAHYDSVEDCSAADDNASGLALMLEAARILQPVSLRRSVVFVAFDEEETGKGGSLAWAARAADEDRDIVAVFNADSVAVASEEPDSQLVLLFWDQLFPEHVATMEAWDHRADWILIAGDTASRDQIDVLSAHADRLELPAIAVDLPRETLMDQFEYWDLTRSDHESFWMHGYPGLWLCDTLLYRTDTYHCKEDEDAPESLDLAFARKVSEMTIASVAEAAELAD